ncbi:chlororespiratory reduction protein 7 [Synechococcus sp. MIT S9507]|uniref:chlororespiratory reduction protein 7 n=1 Tax=Synechococcus sp. MIT S9507 TaxID=3082544 RepID=UPI0039B41D27
MSDPLIRSLDHYVVLVPGEPEQLLTAEDTLTWLAGRLKTLAPWPSDLRGCASPEEAALRLMDTACELEISPGISLQWYAVRLDPPGA